MVTAQRPSRTKAAKPTTQIISAKSDKRHRRTNDEKEAIRNAIVAVLRAYNPMTVRQAYYRLVAAQLIDNNRGQYQAISDMLVDLRKDGTVPWEWVEDRLRQPREVSMWDDLPDYIDSVRHWYRRDVWATQPVYLECWLEKDALSGIFEDVLMPYGVTLNVGRGFDGWDSIHNAAERYELHDDVVVLYWGDFDPSGENMVHSLRERLAELGATPEIHKCGLRKEDIERYNLPPALTKPSDTRSAAFVALHGDIAVELDALPILILKARIKQEVEARMDMQALDVIKRKEAREVERLRTALKERL